MTAPLDFTEEVLPGDVSASTTDALDIFTLAGARRGAQATLPLALGILVYGSVFGVLARQADLTLMETTLMSALVMAGSAQFVVVGMWATPLPIPSIIVTTFAVNLRHLMMGATVRPLFTRFSSRQAYGSLFTLADENWALSMSRFERGERDGAFLLGSGIVTYLAWLAATVTGYVAGSAIGDPEAIGFDFAFTIVFTGLLALLFKGKTDLAPWITAAIVAITADRLLPGNWYIVAGGLAGCLVGAARYGR